MANKKRQQTINKRNRERAVAEKRALKQQARQEKREAARAEGSITLTVVQNEPEADVICGLLRASGIRSFRRGGDLISSAYPVGPVSPIEVVVDEADLVRAQEVLEGLPGGPA
jgi:hypothetical protein